MTVKGFTYQIDQENGLYAFGADVGPNNQAWFKHYTTPSAFEASEVEYGSSWSIMTPPGTIESPGSGSLNPETGGKFVVHQSPDGDGNHETNVYDGVGAGFRSATWNGEYFYTADRTSGTIYKTDKTFTQLSSFSQGGGPITVTWDGEYIWVGGFDSSVAYQVKEDGTEVNNFSTPHDIVGMAWDGRYLNICNQGSDDVYRYKTDGTQVDHFNTTIGDTRGLAFDGVYIWVSDLGGGEIKQYTRGGTQIRGFNVSENPHGLCWDGMYLYDISFDSDKAYQYGGDASIDVSYRFSEVST